MQTILNSKGIKFPQSPFNLLQEIYITDPWKILVCCIFLNQTKRAQVDKIRETFFRKWPTPKILSQANPEEVVEMIKSLGFYNRRSKTLIRFSEEWERGGWKTPEKLPGIGRYAMDSWKIFVEGKLVKDPSDHILNDYMEWRTNHH